MKALKEQLLVLPLLSPFLFLGMDLLNLTKHLGSSLELAAFQRKRYYDVIKLVYPAITDILDGMGTEKQDCMKAILPEEIGS